MSLYSWISKNIYYNIIPSIYFISGNQLNEPSPMSLKAFLAFDGLNLQYLTCCCTSMELGFMVKKYAKKKHVNKQTKSRISLPLRCSCDLWLNAWFTNSKCLPKIQVNLTLLLENQFSSNDAKNLVVSSFLFKYVLCLCRLNVWSVLSLKLI